MASSSVAAKVCLIVIDGWGISEETKGKLEQCFALSPVLPDYHPASLYTQNLWFDMMGLGKFGG